MQSQKVNIGTQKMRRSCFDDGCCGSDHTNGGQKKISDCRFAKEWILNKAGDCVFGFGYRPFKFAVSSILFLLFCSVLTHASWPALGMHNSNGVIRDDSFINAIYYTVVVTTTLGFGDIIPTTVPGQLFASFLSVVGLIWFSLLAALVIRRVVR